MMATHPIWQYHHYPTIDSTNRIAQNRIQNGDTAAFECHHSDIQTAGKGRFDRAWQSPIGNLSVSFVLPIEKQNLRYAYHYSFVAGLSLFQAIASLMPVDDIWLKWPNDVYYKDQKIAGILCQAVKNHVIIGIGVNVATPYDDLSACLTQIQPALTVTDILSPLSHYLYDQHVRWQNDGFDAIRDDWCAHTCPIGTHISTTINDVKTSCIFQGIQDDGALQCDDLKGNSHLVYSGDISINEIAINDIPTNNIPNNDTPTDDIPNNDTPMTNQQQVSSCA